MKSAATVTGRGRPPNLQQKPLTNRLLLQLELLRLECHKSWNEISSFLPRVADQESQQKFQGQGFNVKLEIEAARKLAANQRKAGGIDLDTFLSVNIADQFAVRNVGPFLLKLGVCRQHLLNQASLKDLAPPDAVVDLMFFLKKEGLPVSQSRPTFEFFGLSIADLSNQQLHLKLNKVVTAYRSLNKSIKLENGQQKMNLFLCKHVDLETAQALSTSSFVQPPATPSASNTRCAAFTSPECIALTSAKRSTAALMCQLDEVKEELASERQKNKTLSDISVKCHKDIRNMQGMLENVKTENTSRQQKILELKQQLQNTKDILKRNQHCNFYKRLKRKEKQLQKKQAILHAHETGVCEKTARSLRHWIKLLQTQVSNRKARLASLQERKDWEIAQLQQVLADILQRQQPPPQVKTRNENSLSFTDEAKKTIRSLVGAQVSAENCSKVIQAVVRYMLDVEIPLDSLPSERTVIRYADQAHILAKMPVAETVLVANFDLHVAGTSRDHKKYVGQQVTTSAGSLACGFTPVAVENAATLVETKLNLLQELSEVYSDEEREQNFLRILGNLSGVMSDRASVMKKYKEELNDAIKTTLGTQENIQFLYCNAHFLLGLSSTSDKTLKGVYAELKEDRIGRDPNPRFQRYSVTEAAAVRYIRMACEVLGPRGDEKNWCRDAWLAYCSMSSQPPLVTSFKGNRFNNLFEAASALHFHRQHIVEFFTIYMADRNQKLESVLNDAESDSVAVYVLALALMYHKVTGSYWKLLGSKTHYLDFYQHVVVPFSWTICHHCLDSTCLKMTHTKLQFLFQKKQNRKSSLLFRNCHLTSTLSWIDSLLTLCQADATMLWQIQNFGRNWHTLRSQICLARPALEILTCPSINAGMHQVITMDLWQWWFETRWWRNGFLRKKLHHRSRSSKLLPRKGQNSESGTDSKREMWLSSESLSCRSVVKNTKNWNEPKQGRKMKSSGNWGSTLVHARLLQMLTGCSNVFISRKNTLKL